MAGSSSASLRPTTRQPGRLHATAATIIGPGRHGTAIGKVLVAHGVDLTIFHHKPAKAEAAAAAISAAARNGGSVRVAKSLAEAAEAADVVALTTLWDAPQRAVLAEIGDRLVGRVLLDVSNPLDVTPAGIIPRRPAEGSAGQFVATLLPAGVGHAKAFSNLNTAVITAAADKTPPAVLAYLADSRATNDIVRPVLEHTGWQPRYVGDLSQSAELEIGGKYNAVHGHWGRSALEPGEFAARFGPEVLPA